MRTPLSRTLRNSAQGGDVVVVFSNGGFGGIHGKLLERLGTAIIPDNLCPV